MSEYSESVDLLCTEHPALAAEIAGFGTLESVLRWMERRGIALDKIEIVFQDEFSHDFLIPYDTGGRWLAFGTT